MSEPQVAHPQLPIRGFIDLVIKRSGGTVIVDFKTGSPKDDHAKQVQLYSLMWWRSTGDLPSSAEVVYFTETQRFAVDQARLEELEEELSRALQDAAVTLKARPAPAVLNDECGCCGVRQYCTSYWSSIERAQIRSEDVRDLEMEIEALRNQQGFTGRTKAGTLVSVVYMPKAAVVWDIVKPGCRLRLLGGRLTEDGDYEFTQWPEMFLAPDVRSPVL